MRRTLLADRLLARLAAALMFTAASALWAETAPVRVGILQVDGLLVPMFRHREGVWSAPWPPGGESRDAVIDGLSDVPEAWLGAAEDPSGVWSARLFDGTAPDLRPLRPTYSDSCGEGIWGLQTDFPPRPARCPGLPEHEGACCPFEKAGLAFDAPVSATVFTAVESDSPRRSALLSTIWPELNRQEHAVMRAYVEALRRGVENLARQRGQELDPGDPLPHGASGFASHLADRPVPAPTELNTVVARDTDGSALYHVTAVRTYARAPDSHDPDCWDLTLFSGWVRESPGGALELLQGQVTADTCDMKRVASISPLGRFHLASGTYILAHVGGYETEEYVVLEDRGDRVVPASEPFLYYGL